jgi:hypothetical protein
MAAAVEGLRNTSDVDIEALAAWLASRPPVRDPADQIAVSARAKPLPANFSATEVRAPPPAHPNPTQTAAQLFSGFCASCHMPNGAGSPDGHYPSPFHNSAVGRRNPATCWRRCCMACSAQRLAAACLCRVLTARSGPQEGWAIQNWRHSQTACRCSSATLRRPKSRRRISRPRAQGGESRATLNREDETMAESSGEDQLDRVLQEVPKGAVALAGIAVGLLILAWLMIYLFVFLPRGAVG